MMNLTVKWAANLRDTRKADTSSTPVTRKSAPPEMSRRTRRPMNGAAKRIPMKSITWLKPRTEPRVSSFGST